MEIIRNIQERWMPFKERVDSLGFLRLERPTASGWSTKQMLGHVAFWDEAVEGAVLSLFRKLELPEGWRFGSGYRPGPGEWPSFEAHNAREAEWAQRESSSEVIARLESAHAALLRFLETVTDSEAEEHAAYFADLGKHYEEHLRELLA